MRKDTLPLSLQIDKSLRRNLKVTAMLRGRTMRYIVEAALRRELARKERR